MDVAGVKTYTEFEVIYIMGDKDPYPTLLGIDWAYENYAIIDLKKEFMIFEVEGMRVIQPLDPYEGPRFTELVDDRDELGMLDQLYRLMTRKREDYINPIIGGSVSWRSIQSLEFGSEVAWNAWQQGGYEIDTRHCAKICRINGIGAEVRNYPTLHDIDSVDTFLNKVDKNIREDHKVPLLDIALHATPVRWWKAHQTLRVNGKLSREP